MPVAIAINGFGRIGRNFFRAAYEQSPAVEIAVINDLDLVQLVSRDAS